MTEATTHDELLRLETALATRIEPAPGRPLAELIADDCVEFGASGRTWDADGLRALVASGEPDPGVVIERFATALLAPGVVLATYRVAGARPSNRASVWVRRGDRWQLRFHQGTPIPG